MKSEQELAALRLELDGLNAAVKQAIEQRKRWMDSHMEDFAKFAIGDEIWDLEAAKRVGVVRGYYRYHADDPRYDDNMEIHYQYSDTMESRGFDNTSRHGWKSWGTREEARQRLLRDAEFLR